MAARGRAVGTGAEQHQLHELRQPVQRAATQPIAVINEQNLQPDADESGSADSLSDTGQGEASGDVEPDDSPPPSPVQADPDGNQVTEPSESLWSRKIVSVSLSLSRILAISAFFLAVLFGTAAWLGMDYANKYAKGSYQIALYEFCLGDDMRHEPACRETLAGGLESLVVHKRDLSRSPGGQMTSISGQDQAQANPTTLEVTSFFARDVRPRYLATWQVRDVTLSYAIQQLETHLSVLLASEANQTAAADARRWQEELTQQYDSSRKLYGMVGPDAKPGVDFNVFVPPLVLTEQFVTLEKLGHLVELLPSRGAPEAAVRKFLVAEELLIRVTDGTRLPRHYSLPESATVPLSATIAELDQQIIERRRVENSASSIGFAVFLRLAMIMIAFELGVLPVAPFCVADMAAPYLAFHPRLYASALGLSSLLLWYFLPPHGRLRLRLPRKPSSEPVLLYWFLWSLNYPATEIQSSLSQLAPAGPQIADFCNFVLHADAVSDTFPKVIFSVALLHMWNQELRTRRDILRNAAKATASVFPYVPERKVRRALGLLVTLALICAGFVVVLIAHMRLLSYFNLGTVRDLDKRGYMPINVLGLSALYMQATRRDFHVGYALASCTVLASARDFALVGDYQRCAGRFSLASQSMIQASNVADFPIWLCLWVMLVDFMRPHNLDVLLAPLRDLWVGMKMTGSQVYRSFRRAW